MRRGICCPLLWLFGVALPILPRASETDRSYELIALDERTGRAVLIDVAGATQVLRLDEETPDGLLLKSVTNGSALLDVRYASPGDVIAYRVGLGETLRIRSLPEHRSGGARVMTLPLQETLPSHDSASEAAPATQESSTTPAKD